LSVVFEGESANLPAGSADGLRDIAARLKGQEDMRIQLMAYAGGADMQASKARRLSLSRALAVRTYLIENGVRSTRIDVRALGNKTTEEPVNRVDVLVADR
jgi:outer membrane protein OmpA-like peptidoglycan-associated protein